MKKLTLLLIITISFFAFSCSTITKKDCGKDLYRMGLDHGKSGSPKNYADDLRSRCIANNPNLDVQGYERGFSQGWMQYCVPSNAFDMGRRSDRYFSFCPPEGEALFREKYLAGKHYAELKDVEEDILTELEDMKGNQNENSTNSDNYLKLTKELEKVRRDMGALEVEGRKSGTTKPK